VIHEFAHQLDFLHGNADGTLDLDGKGPEWRQVATAEYEWLRRQVHMGRETFLGETPFQEVCLSLALTEFEQFLIPSNVLLGAQKRSSFLVHNGTHS